MLDDIEKIREAVREIAARELVDGGPGDSTTDQILTWCKQGEAGDAAFFQHLYRGHLVKDHSEDSWYRFNEHFWKRCKIQEPLAMFDPIIDAYERLAHQAAWRRTSETRGGDSKAAEAAAKIEAMVNRKIAVLRTRRHRVNVLALAGAGPNSLGITGEEWDTKPWWLPVANGVIELPTMTFRPGRPEDWLRKHCVAEYRGLEAPRPKWDKFLLEIFDGDQEVVDFVQCLFGQALVGEVLESVFPVFYGPFGRNGKTTLMEAVAQHVLGPLAWSMPVEVLIAFKESRSGEAPTPMRKNLRGKRIVYAGEPEENKKLNAGLTKLLTGADTISARGIHDKDVVDFVPSHTLFLLSNFQLRANPQDEAAWHRLKEIKLPLSFVDEPVRPHERQRNPHLPAELKAEASGILAWLLEGFLRYREVGLLPPPSVKASTKEWRRSDDSVFHFVQDCCERVEGGFILLKTLHPKYKEWCEARGFRPYGDRKVSKILAMDFPRDKGEHGVFFENLILKS
jgi:putative DNA primase/helicase